MCARTINSGTFFMQRWIKAFRNSVAAFGHLSRNETAFKQECWLLLAAVPVAYIVARDISEYFTLLIVIVVIILVEVLNTAIEAACDAVTSEFNDNIKIAKDCGSLAVLLACGIATVVWALAIINWAIG